MKRISLTIAAIVLGSGAAFAATDLGDIDTNGDGFASYDEIAVAYPGLSAIEFTHVDGNGDNRVSANELRDADAQAILDRYRVAVQPRTDGDTDGDGFLSRDEAFAAVPGLNVYDFQAVDANGDNRLSRNELNAPVWVEKAAFYGTAHNSTAVQGVARLDTDGDQFLSFEELSAAYPSVPSDGLRQIDRNDDARISAAELSNGRTTLTQY